MIRLRDRDELQWIDFLSEDEASEVCSCAITHKLASICGAVECDAQIVFNALDCNEQTVPVRIVESQEERKTVDDVTLLTQVTKRGGRLQ